MVEFGSGPVKETIDNTVFIIPGIIIAILVDSMEEESDTKQEFGKVGVSDATSTIVIFLIFTLLIGSVLGFFTYKLVSSLRNKQKLKEEKKKMKQQRKDKELQKKVKKK